MNTLHSKWFQATLYLPESSHKTSFWLEALVLGTSLIKFLVTIGLVAALKNAVLDAYDCGFVVVNQIPNAPLIHLCDLEICTWSIEPIAETEEESTSTKQHLRKRMHWSGKDCITISLPAALSSVFD